MIDVLGKADPDLELAAAWAMEYMETGEGAGFLRLIVQHFGARHRKAVENAEASHRREVALQLEIAMLKAAIEKMKNPEPVCVCKDGIPEGAMTTRQVAVLLKIKDDAVRFRMYAKGFEPVKKYNLHFWTEEQVKAIR